MSPCRPARSLPLLCCLLATAAAPCLARAESRLRSTLADPAWPDDFWKTSTPEAEGVDPARLEAAVRALETASGEVHSFLVIRHGKLVLERYGTVHGAQLGPDDLRRVYSVTKSFTAALIGIAIAEKRIPSVSARVVSFFGKDDYVNPEPDKERITVEDLLTMRSGLDHADDRFNPLELARDPAGGAFPVLSSLMAAPPGTRWAYSTADSQLLAELLRRATGEGPRAYAEKRLLGPLGIKQVRWETDTRGTELGGFGLWLRPRDLARFGYLYLSKGRWKGTQLVPESWVAESTRVHVAGVKPSADYGYQCWIPRFGGFSLQGYLGQYVYVLPDRDLVVVFTADLPSFDEVLDGIMRQHVLPAVR